MPMQKEFRTSAYHSRFQTPFRRRQEGKTDYYQRKRLVTQHKAKYNSPKYRLVVRFTNKDIIAQIVSAHITGDVVFTAAYAHELPRYGIKYGLTNWSAAYAVGLLVARRALQKLGLDETYTGVEEVEGEFELTEAVEDGPRPFKVFLDIGLQRTTTGARVFGVLKGASDGGLYVPHSPNRFPGWDIEAEELDAELLRKYIFGGHVAEYMEELLDDDEENTNLSSKTTSKKKLKVKMLKKSTLTLTKPLELTHLSNQLKRNSPKNNTRLNLRNTDNKN